MRKLTITEHMANAKRADQLPATWTGTLKSYLAVRLAAPTCPGRHATAVTNITATVRYYNLTRVGGIKYEAAIDVDYLSQGRWGLYNPHSYLRITKVQLIELPNGGCIALRQGVYQEHLGHGSKLGVTDSKLRTTTTTPYKKAMLTTSVIVWRGRKFLARRKLAIGATSYHCGDLSLAAAYKELQNKLTIQRNNRRRAQHDRVTLGPCLQKSGLMSNYGWCEEGIDDFCSALQLSAPVRCSDVIHQWRGCDSSVKSRLKREYAEEIATILRVCRAKMSKTASKS